MKFLTSEEIEKKVIELKEAIDFYGLDDWLKACVTNNELLNKEEIDWIKRGE